MKGKALQAIIVATLVLGASSIGPVVGAATNHASSVSKPKVGTIVIPAKTIVIGQPGFKHAVSTQKASTQKASTNVSSINKKKISNSISHKVVPVKPQKTIQSSISNTVVHSSRISQSEKTNSKTYKKTKIKETSVKKAKSIKEKTKQKVTASHKTTSQSKHSNYERLTNTPNIRVLLGSRSGVANIQSANSMVLTNDEGRKITIYSVGTPIRIAPSGGNIIVNGSSVGPVAHLKSMNEVSSFTYDGKNYRGGLTAVAVGGAMRIVNDVPLEEYLYGVVPHEAIPSWPAPALEAQAVAARTYALYTMDANKNKDYDVKPTTDNQVYNGKSGEYVSTTAAVDATKGMVMFYNGKPINALFHSDGGGYTEDSANVWGTPIAYLRGVKDYSKSASTSTWVESLSKNDLQYKLSAAGKSVGILRSINLSPLALPPMNVVDRGISGRIKSATFVGSNGSVTVSGEDLQAILGLKSTLFDFYINHKPTEMDGNTTKAKAYHTFTNGNDIIYIKGHGWGHGLGMSQWGAAEMAKNAPANDGNYYKQILSHYYSGININKMY